jgi:hypothetical protein
VLDTRQRGINMEDLISRLQEAEKQIQRLLVRL